MTEQEIPQGTVGDTASESDEAPAAEPDGSQDTDGDGADVKSADPEASEG